MLKGEVVVPSAFGLARLERDGLVIDPHRESWQTLLDRLS
jgi:hypothetical protein